MLATAITHHQAATIIYLGTKFPKTSCFGAPMSAAIDTDNAEVLRAVCSIDPATASTELGDDSTILALGYACSRPNGAELVKVLLEAGADPNEMPPFRLPGCLNVSAAVQNGLPTETFEYFFDAGYRGNDPYVVRLAVEKGRKDVLDVLFKRCVGIPEAQFPDEHELIDLAKEKGHEREIVEVIKRGYEARFPRKKGLFKTLVGKFRS
ncbi:hypothetical protein P280DRAFT_517812 [Massarina eburnea CBS 473.64]|uniref:Ankyrin n=1 Tax=Massarina eburnea CBS 473.64 TaxID=1395130 RepID=A0A6A6S255_9PLEO|nr:hypothetical protein P280DRAFT_517812 [Massarina eburnea CBS 473.64]